MEHNRPETTTQVDLFNSSKRIASLLQYNPENRFVKRPDCDNVYQRMPSSQRTERSDREDWVLPSDRKEYITTHDSTKLARLHSRKDNNVPPVWTKVTKTPW
jgi:hypothetical protein